VDAHGDAHAYVDAHPDGDADMDTDGDAYGDGYADGDTDRHTDPYGDVDLYIHTHANGDLDVDADRDADAYGDATPHDDAHPYRDGDGGVGGGVERVALEPDVSVRRGGRDVDGGGFDGVGDRAGGGEELVFRGEGASTLGWLGETVGGSVRLMEGGVVFAGEPLVRRFGGGDVHEPERVGHLGQRGAADVEVGVRPVGGRVDGSAIRA
jgi:hypothetical protein